MMTSLLPIFSILSLMCGTDSQPAWFSYPVPYFFESSDVVQTSSGPVRGTDMNFNGVRVKQYLGIPYATPPVGELRFQKPRPVEPWTETLVANTMPPACVQYQKYVPPWYDDLPGKSEDCLYLNIWAPQSRSNFESKSVIFWIYGGGYNVGSNRIWYYNGLTLAAYGDVVVVTINYRLGAFGFFTSGTQSAPGNVALYDMLEALKWVNKNIAAFGGDPNQVTIAGESVGSESVGYFCLSPLTQGLFKRAIMESGSPAYLNAEDNTANLATSQKLAEIVGCADKDVKLPENSEFVVSCMRRADAFKIAEIDSTLRKKSGILYTPSYGDDFVPTNARIRIINHQFRPVDVLIGNNRDEGSVLITGSYPDVFGFYGEKDPKINKSYGESLLREGSYDFPDLDAVIRHYLGHLKEDDYCEVREQVYTALGDFLLLCPTVYFAESYGQVGNNVFFYYLEKPSSATPWAKWMGTAHFDDVPYVFGVPLQNPSLYNSTEVYLSRRMMQYWSSFAKYGYPSMDWPLYSRENPFYLPLRTENPFMYGIGPHKGNCDFFRKYFGFS